jgi:hypothetical protein
MECPKCGMELVDTQKVCVGCGALTPAGGFFYLEDTKWKPSKKIKIAAASVLGIIFILILIQLLKITPPDKVASRWFECLADRQIVSASKLVTDNFTNQLSERMTDLRALSDEYYYDNNETVTISASEPEYDMDFNPTEAKVTLSVIYSGGRSQEIRLELIKDGRRWLVNAFK